MLSLSASKQLAAVSLGLALAVLGCGGVMTGPNPVAGPPTGWTDSTVTVKAGDQLTFVAAGLGYIPCAGSVLDLLIVSIGLGAVVLTRFGGRVEPAAPAGAPAETA